MEVPIDTVYKLGLSALYRINNGLILFFCDFSDIDIMRVSVCICLFFVILFAVLRWIPKSFTIGEAMVISETIVLLSVDSYTNLGLKVSCTHQNGQCWAILAWLFVNNPHASRLPSLVSWHSWCSVTQAINVIILQNIWPYLWGRVKF